MSASMVMYEVESICLKSIMGFIQAQEIMPMIEEKSIYRNK